MKLFASIASAFLISSSVVMADVTVIVHPSVASSASADDISRLFLGKRKTLSDGYKVIPLNLSEGNAVRSEFNDKVLGKSDSQLKSYWSKLIFTGKGQPPKEFDSEAEIIKMVKDNPNMIGYVSSGSVTADVKALGSF